MGQMMEVQPVEQIVQLLAGIDEAAALLLEMRTEAYRLASEIPDMEQALNNDRRRVLDLMKKIDVYSSGNMGFEHRVTGFLVLLRRIALRNQAPVAG